MYSPQGEVEEENGQNESIKEVNQSIGLCVSMK